MAASDVTPEACALNHPVILQLEAGDKSAGPQKSQGRGLFVQCLCVPSALLATAHFLLTPAQRRRGDPGSDASGDLSR